MIKSLVMQGFKSFPKRVEISFNENFNSVIGPNGAGKCLGYDSHVQLADGSRVKIGELVEEKLKKNNYYKIEDGFVIDGDDTEILSLDIRTLKLNKKKISKFIKRTSPEEMVWIKTRSGREIEATEHHPLFILEKDRIRSISAGELKEGIKVAVPRFLDITLQTKTFTELLDMIMEGDNIFIPFDDRYKEILLACKKNFTYGRLSKRIGVPLNAIKGILDRQAINFAYLVKTLRYAQLSNAEIIKLIPHFKGKGNSKCYRIPWDNSPSLARFFGHLTAEGRLPPSSSQIWFVNGNEEVCADYIRLVRELFCIEPLVREYKEECLDIIFYSKPLSIFLSKLGMGVGGTANKKITNLFLKHSSCEEIAEFLNGLYSGDGYVSNHSIEIITKSFELAQGIETILLRLGILSNSAVKIKIAKNSGFSGVYKQISISCQANLEAFCRQIRLVHPEKRKALELAIGKKTNPNLDLIEANHLVKTASRQLGINIKKLRGQFPRLDSYVYNQCTPSRNGLQLLISCLFDGCQQAEGSEGLSALKLLAYSDIFWDEIIETERISPAGKYVYDLTIEDNHNFIADNFIVHNSNVCDAVCFVLGKTSAKDMRAEKSANLIYNGGKSSKPAKEAQVSIVFDNSKQIFPVMEKEVVITRTVKQSGNSVYKINNEVRTRQQVVDLLSAAHIDPDGHNIILQGDIGRFVDMKSNERRELIEEVAGISVFEERKQKALNELSHVQEKLNEAEIILAEREKTLSDLKKDRDIAMRYKELEGNITRNKATRTNMLLQEKEAVIQEEESRIADFEKRLAKAKSEIEDIIKSNEGRKEQVSVLSKELDIGQKQAQISKHSEEIRVAQANQESRRKVCLGEIDKINAKRSELKNALEEGDRRIKDIGARLKLAAKSLAEMKAKEKKIEPAHKSDLNEIEGRIEEKGLQVKKIEETIQDALRLIDRVEIELKTKKEKLQTAEKEKSSLSKLESIRNEFEDISGRISSLSNELSVFSIQISNEKAKLAKMEIEGARRDAISEFFGDKALRQILSSKMEGVYGTISSLGKAEAKYSLACEVAAGQRLKSLVVGTDSVAARCIALLKQSKAGIATFLPLNKLRERGISNEMKEIIAKKEDGVIGLASNLVKFSGRFKSAFEYVFGSTLVMDNLSTARRIGIGRIRMVTLEGDLIEMSGAMVGGYREKLGAFSSLETKEREEELSKLKVLISLIETKKSDAEKEIEVLREKRSDLYAELKSLEKIGEQLGIKDYGSLKEDIKNLAKQKADAERGLKDAKGRCSNLSKELERLKSERQKALSAYTGSKEGYEGWQAVVNEIARQESEIKVLGREKELQENENERVQAIIKQNEKEAEQFAKETRELNDKIKETARQVKEQEIRQKRFVESYQGMFKKREKLIGQIQQAESALARNEERLLHIEEKKNEVSVRKALLAGELEGLKKEFEQYKDVSLRRGMSLKQLEEEIKSFEIMLKDMGNVNFRALEVYERLNEEHGLLMEKHSKLKTEKEDVLNLMQEIESRKKDAFMKTFHVLARNFKEIFGILSAKGEASLVLENMEEPFAGGADIIVKIAEGRALDIRGLSGGEKTLAALSFIFAIQEYDPASFYLLDEVDAALDKKNSEFLSKLISKYSQQAQYIVISHNDAVISEAEVVYGVSMQDGVSKVVSLKL